MLSLLAACDDGLYTGSFLFDGTHTFEAGQGPTGDLLVRAGTAEFTPGSKLDGSLYVLGGEVRMDGQVAGNVVGVGGRLTLGPTAMVDGDLVEIGAEVTIDDATVVRGDMVRNADAALPLANVGSERTTTDWLRLLAGALLMAGLGGLIVRGRPGPVVNLGEAVIDHALVCGAIGLLLVLILPSLLVMMGFTVVLLPLVFVLGFALLLLLLFGQIALGYQLGNWVADRLRWSLSPSWRAFGGTLLLLGLFAIPYLGQGLLAITLVLGLGALLLTRAGLRPYTPETWGAEEELGLESYGRPQAGGRDGEGDAQHR